jgi:hypothetical protein
MAETFVSVNNQINYICNANTETFFKGFDWFEQKSLDRWRNKALKSITLTYAHKK